MRKTICAAAVATATLLPPLSGAKAAMGRPVSRVVLTRGQALAVRMERALLKQKRVQVTGVLTQGNLPATRFRFRYQTPNRESVVRFGGLLGRVRVGNRPLTQDREVSIGKAVYRSIDGKHWVHASRFAAPTPFDAMTLNGASANCCEVLSAGSGVTVRYSGTRTAQGRRAYVIDFRLVTSGAVVTTTVLESASSGLPLSFTSTSNPPTAVSRASFDYTSPFSVAQPR